MTRERERILRMVAERKISVEEAEELIDALESGKKAENSETTVKTNESKPLKNPRFFHVTVESTDGDNVNVKVPLALLRAGIRLSSLIPKKVYKQVNSHLSKQGICIDLNNINPDDFHEFIKALSDLEVNVDSLSGDKVRVFCE